MKLGFCMPNLMRVTAMSQPWEARVTGADQARLARWAEKLGYDMINVPEHHIIPKANVALSGAHHVSALPTMAYWAGATETIRINSSVTLLPLQHPVVLAKALATMDWLSEGRMMITFGTGWLESEFDIIGVPFRERGAICDEYIAAILSLWTDDSPCFEGRYVTFHDVAFEPRPVQKPHLPVWFGGEADAVLKRIARHASGWWPFLTRPADIPAKVDFIRSQPDYNGRFADVAYYLGTSRIGEQHVDLQDSTSQPGRSKQQIIDDLGYLGRCGVTISAVPIPAVRSIEEYKDYTQWVAEEIMPVVACI